MTPAYIYRHITLPQVTKASLHATLKVVYHNPRMIPL